VIFVLSIEVDIRHNIQILAPRGKTFFRTTLVSEKKIVGAPTDFLEGVLSLPPDVKHVILLATTFNQSTTTQFVSCQLNT
jgi:hypothetical protein